MHVTNNGFSAAELLVPAAIVVAALVGAWFVARYAGKNVSKELVAAEQRLETQMAHDRELRDRQATREMVDDVVAIMTEVLSSSADFAVSIKEAESFRREIATTENGSESRSNVEERLGDLESGDLGRHSQRSFEALFKCPPAHVRLRLRFPKGHPILIAFNQWYEVVKASRKNFAKGLTRLRTEQELKESTEMGKTIPSSLENFVTAVRDWIDAKTA